MGSWAVQKTRHSALKSILQKDWAHKNRVVMETASVKAAEEEEEPHAETICAKEGLCLCCSAGRQAVTLRNALMRCLKEVCTRMQSSKRQLLLDGHVCLRLTGVASSGRSGNQWQEVLEDLLGETVEGVVSDGTWWYHIGMHYLKPYRATLQVLQPR